MKPEKALKACLIASFHWRWRQLSRGRAIIAVNFYRMWKQKNVIHENRTVCVMTSFPLAFNSFRFLHVVNVKSIERKFLNVGKSVHVAESWMLLRTQPRAHVEWNFNKSRRQCGSPTRLKHTLSTWLKLVLNSEIYSEGRVGMVSGRRGSHEGASSASAQQKGWGL